MLVGSACIAATVIAGAQPLPGATAARVFPSVGGCRVLPADNAWNTDVSKLPVHRRSRRFITNINSDGPTKLHADFGGGGKYGIPYVTVAKDQHRWPIVYTAYGDESDPGPFPIPRRAPVEGGRRSDGDRHVLVVQRGSCRLFELYRAFWRNDHWEADSGAKWNLRSNRLRPRGWTSADAAGLPILPGLVRYDEVAAGEVRHAIRFTVRRTQRGYVLPATHFASSSTDAGRPPMGLRLRLKRSYDLSRFHGQARVILRALKRYGMIVADNGENWFLTGAADPRWDDEDLDQLKTVPGRAFEVVNTGRVHR
ncbi:MAG: hypothetical protein M5T61_05895 [Acidimicrobiia bacterium]|nr:hypothetical protein [Acidimicrobiia bacterium]